MAASPRPARDEHGHHRAQLLIAVAVTLPGLVIGALLALGLPHPSLSPPAEAAVFGIAVVGAAFLLSWGAEVAQLDISAGLAIALLALIAVLPEYAVSFVFAWRGGRTNCSGPGGSDDCALVLANMTGANRLLIGVGWALVVLLAWHRYRKSGRPIRAVELPRTSAVEVSFLGLASLYSLSLPFKPTITLFDTAVLVAIFTAYTARIAKAPAEEPDLVGPAAYLATFSRPVVRAAYVAVFVFSALVILLSAEHFAQGLVDTGSELGISSFFLVQWLAPIASEAPELLVAGLYAWRLHASNGLSTLVSSKINQWTLLVGTLPVVFAVASSRAGGLPVDLIQSHELLLTAAQSIFAVSILLNLDIHVWEACALLGLFFAQFAVAAVVPGNAELTGIAAVYLVLGALLLVRGRRRIGPLLRDGFRTPYADLAAMDATREPSAAER